MHSIISFDKYEDPLTSIPAPTLWLQILTLIATKVGYEVKGEWLEKNAIAINAVMLMGIGIVAYVGF